MTKSNKKLNKGLTIIIVGLVMISFSAFIMSLWVNDFESKKEPVKVEQLKPNHK